MTHPSLGVAFGEHHVAELVHIFVILRRHNGEELAITCDTDGQILSCFNDLGMEASEDILEEEKETILRLVKKREVDYS